MVVTSHLTVLACEVNGRFATQTLLNTCIELWKHKFSEG